MLFVKVQAQIPELTKTGRAFISLLHELIKYHSQKWIIQDHIAEGEIQLSHHHKVLRKQDKKRLEPG